LEKLYSEFKDFEPWVGFEQEYVLTRGRRPLGFPPDKEPAPQGPYYCGVGSSEVFGREIVEEHMAACLAAGIELTGINAEVMPGQWEYQVFGKNLIRVCHEAWLARWLLIRIADKYGVSISFEPKVILGDWNGSGMHTNFSIREMREGMTLKSGESYSGLDVVKMACEFLSVDPQKNLAVYGHGNQNRLTGHHETCSINEFRYGIANRGASIRIPLNVAVEGCGYLEDRRPAANADPYQVCTVLLSTIVKPFKEMVVIRSGV
jgi:glutamine synthetase